MSSEYTDPFQLSALRLRDFLVLRYEYQLKAISDENVRDVCEDYFCSAVRDYVSNNIANTDTFKANHTKILLNLVQNKYQICKKVEESSDAQKLKQFIQEKLERFQGCIIRDLKPSHEMKYFEYVKILKKCYFLEEVTSGIIKLCFNENLLFNIYYFFQLAEMKYDIFFPHYRFQYSIESFMHTYDARPNHISITGIRDYERGLVTLRELLRRSKNEEEFNYCSFQLKNDAVTLVWLVNCSEPIQQGRYYDPLQNADKQGEKYDLTNKYFQIVQVSIYLWPFLNFFCPANSETLSEMKEAVLVEKLCQVYNTNRKKSVPVMPLATKKAAAQTGNWIQDEIKGLEVLLSDLLQNHLFFETSSEKERIKKYEEEARVCFYSAIDILKDLSSLKHRKRQKKEELSQLKELANLFKRTGLRAHDIGKLLAHELG